MNRRENCDGFVLIDDLAVVDSEVQIFFTAFFGFGFRFFLGRTHQAGFGGVFFARFDEGEGRTHCVAGPDFGGDFLDFSAAGGGDLHHGFVGLDLEDILICVHNVSGRDQYFAHGCLGDGFAELGHENGETRHLGDSTAMGLMSNLVTQFENLRIRRGPVEVIVRTTIMVNKNEGAASIEHRKIV